MQPRITIVFDGKIETEKLIWTWNVHWQFSEKDVTKNKSIQYHTKKTGFAEIIEKWWLEVHKKEENSNLKLKLENLKFKK